MIKVGVIGYGYWGPNLVRDFAEADGCELVSVCDRRPERLALVKKRHAHVNVLTDWEDVVSDPGTDVIAISTSVSTHYELALAALESGKHVLVEKPMAMNSEQCLRLIDTAEKRNLVLMVDHTFVYTGAVRKMRELVHDGSLGDLYYYDSVRVNLGLFQHDVNVIWDLAVHDLSIMHFVLPKKATTISATGMSHIGRGPENIAFLTVFFDGTLIAHIHVNWLAPVKFRNTLLGGSRKMIYYNDLEPSEKIRVYDRGITLDTKPEGLYQMRVGYRTGDMWSPKLENTEALRVEIAHLLDCIEHKKRPITDGLAGLEVVRMLEAATESMQAQGCPVELRATGATA